LTHGIVSIVMEANVMLHATRFARTLAVVSLLALPSLSEAGPPLICRPFQTGNTDLLPWGDGPGWNTPSDRYDIRALTRDTIRLLTSNTSVLARMEILRRATIYAAQDPRVADELLAAVIARANGSATPDARTLFDAGYLIESYRQAAHMHRRAGPTLDGYALVKRALVLSGSNAEMEFAASLMTEGAPSAAHRRRAQAGAPTGSLLARNLAG